jgi:hypothetical protein
MRINTTEIILEDFYMQYANTTKILPIIRIGILILVLIPSICIFHEGGHYTVAKLMGYDSATVKYNLDYFGVNLPTAVSIEDRDIAVHKYNDPHFKPKLIASLLASFVSEAIVLLFFWYEAGKGKLIFIGLFWYLCINCSNDFLQAWCTLKCL